MTRSFNKSLTRPRVSTRPKKKFFIISSEGEKTEPKYFKGFSSYKIRVKFADSIGTDPKSVLEVAKEDKEKYSSELRKGDEIWVVVDTDFSYDTRKPQVRNLTKVGKQCKKYGFEYAVSNPCFEFWFLLHFEKTPRLTSTIRIQDECISQLKRHYPNYDKSTFEPKKFIDKTKFAIDNAKNLDRTRDQSWPKDHGSTVYILVEKLLKER